MTAPTRIDQSARIQQHLAEFIHRTKELEKQAHTLEKLIFRWLNILERQPEREKKYSQNFIPLYDREKFYQFNEQSLKKFNRTLLKLFLGTRLLEEIWNKYQSTIQLINSGGG